MWNGGTIFANNRRRAATALLALALLAAGNALADPVKITFIPPPMEGTLSLGIYDASGKLVRTLHREDPVGEPESKLTAGDDGLVTQWDGKNDSGAECPPGAYRARGVMVGDLAVEGVDFIGNDWVNADDSPRLSRIVDVETGVYGDPVITATTPDKLSFGRYALTLEKPTAPGADPEVRLIDRHVSRPPDFVPPSRLPFFPFPGVKEVADWVDGLNDSVWVIQKGAVKQYSQKGDVLRTLERSADDPPAVRLAARDTKRRRTSGLAPDPWLAVFDTGEKLYVLYENAQMQRLRGYDFADAKPGDAPKLLFENDILFNGQYEQIASKLTFPDGKPFTPAPTLKVELVPNPLMDNKPGTLELRVAVDKAGAYLATADGLPLCHLNETPLLRWAVMGRPPGSKEISVFDSDGAVVEQFRVAKAANMMAFDAGTIQWPPPAVALPAPVPSPSPAPLAPPPTPQAATTSGSTK